MVRVPLLAALGLFVVSLGALLLSLGGHSGRSVDRLVGAPGVSQASGGGEIGLTPPQGSSPFAVYVPPPAPPPSAARPAARPATPPPAPRPKTQGPAKHRGH